MVLKSDGTKWACQSCLKGHRVSGCTHTDRELTLVPKKGRPVTQCAHCRQERKKRSAHVSCECGEAEKPHHPKEKCIHLREAEERLKAGFYEEPVADKPAAHLTAVAEEQGCCCHHGGKCTCAILKKESGRGSATPPHGPAVKPRLETTKSDGHITVFQNGHHKPVHRKNHLAHESGVPYKMPLPRANTEHNVSANARRSVDSLALDSSMTFNPSAFTPQTSAPFNTERRMSKSEQPSPKLSGADVAGPMFGSSQVGTMDFSSLAPVQTNQTFRSTSSDAFGYGTMEPMSSVTDGSFNPWSNPPSGDSTGFPNNNPFGAWPTNADLSGVAQPALTAASSGTQSEIDEIPPIDDPYGTFDLPSIQEDVDCYNFNLPAGDSPQSNRRSLPPNFFKMLNSSEASAFNYGDSEASTEKAYDVGQPFDDMDSNWEGTSLPPTRNNFSKPMGGLPNIGRPASRSIGSRNAPNDDDLRALFPTVDVNGTYPTSSMQDFCHPPSTSATATSGPMDFGSLDESIGFTSQAWSDGSVSVPNDDFSGAYDVNQEYPTSDFSTSWSQ